MTVIFGPLDATPQAKRRGRRTAQSRRACSWHLQLAIFGNGLCHRSACGRHRRRHVPKQELQAKMAYCQVCHGASGAGFSWLLSDTAPGRTAARVLRESVAGVHRAQAPNQQYHVQCGSRPEPGDADVSCHQFSRFRSKTAGRCAKDLMAAGKKIYEEGITANRCSCRVRPVTVRKPRATDNFLAWPVSSTITSSTN